MTLVALILADYRTGSPLPVSRGEVDVLWCKSLCAGFHHSHDKKRSVAGQLPLIPLYDCNIKS